MQKNNIITDRIIVLGRVGVHMFFFSYSLGQFLVSITIKFTIENTEGWER